MKSLIIGMGEVGKSLYEVLKDTHDVQTRDVQEKKVVGNPDVMHVCIGYSDDFVDCVTGYIRKYRPRFVDVCTTVPVGTTAKLGPAVHSTTRGLHPNLSSGISTFVKHIGGPLSGSVAAYYDEAGIRTATHKLATTTELAHILNNAAYGINILFADEMQKLCREYGVDYTEAVIAYTRTNNEGYEALDQKSKCRMILTPPNGKIGGHCVTQSANLIPKEKRPPLLELLARYNYR